MSLIVLILTPCEYLTHYISSIVNRLHHGKHFRKSNWKHCIHKMHKELHNILSVGSELYSCSVLKGRQGFLNSLDHFRVYNSFGRKREVCPNITIDNIGEFWRDSNQFYSAIISFSDVVEFVRDDYNNHQTQFGPYLLVELNKGLFCLFAEVFRFLHVLDLCICLYENK